MSFFNSRYFRSLSLFRLLVCGLLAHSGYLFQRAFFTQFLSGAPGCLRWLACLKNWLVSRAKLFLRFAFANFRVHFHPSKSALLRLASLVLNLPNIVCSGFGLCLLLNVSSQVEYFPLTKSVLRLANPLKLAVGQSPFFLFLFSAKYLWFG